MVREEAEGVRDIPKYPREARSLLRGCSWPRPASRCEQGLGNCSFSSLLCRAIPAMPLGWCDPRAFSIPELWDQWQLGADQPFFPSFVCWDPRCSHLVVKLLQLSLWEAGWEGDGPTCPQHFPPAIPVQDRGIPFQRMLGLVCSRTDNSLLLWKHWDCFTFPEVGIWHFSIVSPSWHDMKGIVPEDALLLSWVI